MFSLAESTSWLLCVTHSLQGWGSSSAFSGRWEEEGFSGEGEVDTPFLILIQADWGPSSNHWGFFFIPCQIPPIHPVEFIALTKGEMKDGK